MSAILLSIKQPPAAQVNAQQENDRLKQRLTQEIQRLRHKTLRLSAAQSENAAMRENIRLLMRENALLRERFGATDATRSIARQGI
ncbi:hypothetical protein [Castellaniella sp. GW247-6E4]|uniref:hypothetical protein n=1 Tax=Castellaniella sp. GW247-6E4 TaxID=3140380 RepID=UPI0033154338